MWEMEVRKEERLKYIDLLQKGKVRKHMSEKKYRMERYLIKADFNIKTRNDDLISGIL